MKFKKNRYISKVFMLVIYDGSTAAKEIKWNKLQLWWRWPRFKK